MKKLARFIKREFPPEEGKILLKSAQVFFADGYKTMEQKAYSKEQLLTVKTRILPLLALYVALLEKGYWEEEAIAISSKYLESSAKIFTHILRAFSFFPFFFRWFSKSVKKTMQSDKWESQVVSDTPQCVAIDINKCLRYDSCKTLGYPKFTRVFCDVDHIVFGKLKGVKFERECTLGYGDSCCDFKFSKR